MERVGDGEGIEGYLVMEFCKHPQGTAEWYRDRAGHITASRIDVLMGRGGIHSKSAMSYAAEIVTEILMGEPLPEIKVRAMDWGNANEPLARAHYEWMTGSNVEQVGFCKSKFDMIGCSLDGMIGSEKVVEYKCPYNSARHGRAFVSKDWVDDHKWQVQSQLWITGAQVCDLCSFDVRFPPEYQMVIHPIKRNEDEIFEIETRVLEFRDYIQRKLEVARGRYGIES